MEYAAITDIYEKIEATTKRLEITNLLVGLFSKTPSDEIDKIVYLTQGKLYPDYRGIELGIANKLAIRSLAQASATSEKEISQDLNRTGDLGTTAANFLEKKIQLTLSKVPLTVTRVYETLDRVARAGGEGSQDLKIRLLASLMTDSGTRDAKYIVRTATGKLRLGLADMTILDALAIAFGGSKEARPEIERAYNLSSDLGAVAKTVAQAGLKGLKTYAISVGKPIRAMMAERLSTPQEILEKLGGKGAAEYKYDGERLQVHKNGRDVALYSRRLENVTSHYPDACDLVRQQLNAKKSIVECECVALNPETGELLPFQELMHRRRKYQVAEAMTLYPVSLFVFDALLIENEDLTSQPYTERRRLLKKIVKDSQGLKLAKAKTVDTVQALEEFFQEAIADGCEGLIVKSLQTNSVYQAGARGWLWIKYKRDYQVLLSDTVDLAVIGAFHGMGRRARSYGALLVAAYDSEKDMFQSVCKVGSGFTDEDLDKLPSMLHQHEVKRAHPRVDSLIVPDVWLNPQVILEIVGSEITLSPIHTAARNLIRIDSGLAIRFPRFTGNYRMDKSAQDATTVIELMQMYKRQLKKIVV
ncbi:MAG: ATP-dependent DNA ligase [Candidatus Bathyarchaeia archaeon]